MLHRGEGIIQAICQGCVCVEAGGLRDRGGSREISTESAAEMTEIYPKHIAKDFGSTFSITNDEAGRFGVPLIDSCTFRKGHGETFSSVRISLFTMKPGSSKVTCI